MGLVLVQSLEAASSYILLGPVDPKVWQLQESGAGTVIQNQIKTWRIFEAIHQMLPSDDLARFLCYLDSAAVNVEASDLLNEINIPVFRTNTLVLELPRM